MSARTPRLGRPAIDPSYGITGDPEGASWSDTEAKLTASRNYWVCTTRADGGPHSKPVWGVWLEDALWFGTGDQSVAGRNLARDPRISVHLESGDDVTILEGTVKQFAPSETPTAMKDAYATKYNMSFDDVGDGEWFRLEPATVLTWLEHDFVKSAARWTFE